MAQQIINTGAAANDGTGDPLRTAFTETNNNFTEIYTAGPVGSNVQIANNTILTLNTNGNLVLAPNGTGRVVANVDVVPNRANVRNLGSSSARWSTVYTQYLNVTNGTTVAGDLTVGGNLTVTGNTVQIGNLVTDAKTLQLANTAANANAATGSGITVGASDNIATLLYNSTGNVWTTNIGVSAVGNITAPYFIGNGSQLTGLPVPYGNSNVVTLLAGFGSNTVSTSGNVTAGNVLTSAQVIANGVIQTGTGFSTGGYLSVNGATDLHDTNIIGTLSVNLIQSDDSTVVKIQDGAEIDGDTLVNGNVTADYFIGDGSQLTGLPASYNNSNVTTLLSNLGSNVISGTGNITTTANISGVYIKGNGSELTNLPAPSVAQDITSIGDMSIMTYDGNLKYVNNATVEPATGSIKTAGNISATGNITGAYIFGNGSQLTGLPATYGNSNVTALLGNLGSNAISTTGTVTSGQLTAGAVTYANTDGSANQVLLTHGNGATYFGDVALNSSMNYVQVTPAPVTLTAPGNVVSCTITTNGAPVLVCVNGDANPQSAGGYCTFRLYRDDTVAIGNVMQAESSASNENVPYNIQAIDTPSAGTHTYTMKMLTNAAFWAFGEVAGPVMYAVELTGAQGAPGPAGAVSGNLVGNLTGNGYGANAFSFVSATGNITGGNLISNNTIYGNIDIILGNMANASATRTRLVSNNEFSYIQTGNGTVSSTGNIVFSPYMSSAERVVVDTASGNISAVGNVTAQNFIGNISITGNVQGTSPNVTLVAGSYSWTFDNGGTLTLPVGINGNEGGEIDFAKAANSTLSGNVVVIDQFVDKVRFFEGGGNARGAYIDLTQTAAGVGTLLNNRVSGIVNAGAFVTMDNLNATVTTSGNRGLSLATVSGTVTGFVSSSYSLVTGGANGAAGSISLTTTPSSSIQGYNFTSEGDTAIYVVRDNTNNRVYRITMMIGGAYNNNFISIERLI
jgi:hypothetical protein